MAHAHEGSITSLRCTRGQSPDSSMSAVWDCVMANGGCCDPLDIICVCEKLNCKITTVH